MGDPKKTSSQQQQQQATNATARSLYENAGSTTVDPNSFISTFMQQYGAGATGSGGQFPTAPSGSLNATTRASDTVYVRSPLHTSVTSQQANAGLGEGPNQALTSRTTTGGATPLSADQALNAFIGGSSNQITTLQQRLVQAGYLKPGDYIPGIADQATKDAYKQLLSDGADEAAAGKKTTLEDILDARAKALKNNPGAGGLINGTRTTSSSTSSIDLTNPSQARAYAENYLSDLLGRMPTQQEYQDYVGALHSEESAHPTVTNSTTSTSYQAGQATGSHTSETVNQGGADPQMVAESYAYAHHGDEVAQVGLLNLLDSFRKLVDGGA